MIRLWRIRLIETQGEAVLGVDWTQSAIERGICGVPAPGLGVCGVGSNGAHFGLCGPHRGIECALCRLELNLVAHLHEAL
jgi:hypothetical protein